MRALLLLLLSLLLQPALAAEEGGDFAFSPRLGATLPAGAALRDEAGQPLTLGAVEGGVPLVLALGYFRCPGLCGIVRDDTLSALDRAGLRAGTDYRLLVLSIDPAETPEDAARAKEGALSRYPDAAAASGWRFLTAPSYGIDALAAAAGFRYRFDPATKQFMHPAGLVVATPEGTVSGALGGVGYDPAALRSAVLRAGAGEVAQALSPVLLLCFHFDPKTGGYDLAVGRALAVMAALTMVTVCTALVLLHRRRT